MSLPVKPDYLPVTEKGMSLSDESNCTEQLSEMQLEQESSGRRTISHPCQPDSDSPEKGRVVAEHESSTTYEPLEQDRSNRSLLEEVIGEAQPRPSDASPGSEAWRDRPLSPHPVPPGVPLNESGNADSQCSGSARSEPQASSDAPKASLRDAWRDAGEEAEEQEETSREFGPPVISETSGNSATKSLPTQHSQNLKTMSQGSQKSGRLQDLLKRVSLQSSVVGYMDHHPDGFHSSVGSSMAMRRLSLAAEAANQIGADLMAPGACVRAVWDQENHGGENDDYFACVSLKEMFAATCLIYVEMTLMVIGVMYLEHQTNNMVLMQGVVIGMVFGWSVSYWLVVDYFIFDGRGALFTIKASGRWPFLKVEFSEDRELFHGSFASALLFTVTCSVASLTSLSMICIAMSGVVANIAATFAYARWRNGQEGFMRVAYVFGGFFICFIIAVHGYTAAWYYDLLRTYVPWTGGVIFSGMFAGAELLAIVVARTLFRSLGKGLPKSKATISWIIMFVFSSNEAFRLAVLLSDTVMTEAVTWQTGISLASALLINGAARTQWAVYFALRLSKKLSFLAPSCAMIVLLECKLTMGYARFAAPLTLMTARLVMGGKGHWYFHDAVVQMLAASFLLEFLEDVFVEVVYRKGWAAPVHEVAQDYYEGFPVGHIRRPYTYTYQDKYQDESGESPTSPTTSLSATTTGKVKVIHLEPFPTRALYTCIANCVVFFGYSQMIPFLSFPFVLGQCAEPRMSLVDILFWPTNHTCLPAHQSGGHSGH